jgi:hypothetical protein
MFADGAVIGDCRVAFNPLALIHSSGQAEEITHMIRRQFGHSIQLSSHQEGICGKQDSGACQVSCFRLGNCSQSA